MPISICILNIFRFIRQFCNFNPFNRVFDHFNFEFIGMTHIWDRYRMFTKIPWIVILTGFKIYWITVKFPVVFIKGVYSTGAIIIIHCHFKSTEIIMCIVIKIIFILLCFFIPTGSNVSIYILNIFSFIRQFCNFNPFNRIFDYFNFEFISLT